MASTVTSAAKQAEQLRKDGNSCFKKDRFGAAIDAYTEAITLCPNVPVYWTNRAICHHKRNDWARVEEDSRKAIQLDKNSVKGHYMLGLAFLQRGEYNEGIKQLERALDLGRGANHYSDMIDVIWQAFSKAKYLEWEFESTKRMWDLQTLKEACESALEEKLFLGSCQTDNEATIAHSARLDLLGKVFTKVAEDDTPTEVPDYLRCTITLEIFHDPVITPSGVTYERAVILDHLQKVGKFDPITRKPLYPSDLIPNLAIKAAVQAFLDKHGWAYTMD